MKFYREICSLADILYRRLVKNQMFLFELQYTLILDPPLRLLQFTHSLSWIHSYIGNK